MLPQALVTEPWPQMVGTRYAYAQGVAGNAWQAQNRALLPGEMVVINELDWGDMLESAPLKLGSPVRIEVTMYVTSVTMTGFEMALLANASSPDEVQGVLSDVRATPAPGGAVDEAGLYKTYGEATMYSPAAKLVVQKLVGVRETVQPGDLAWNGSAWVDNNPDDPSDIGAPDTSVKFGGEINVGGKVLYGLSEGGWRPTSAGDYRLTFYLPTTSQARFDASTTIRVSTETEGGETGGGGGAVIDPTNNLSYIDVRVAGSGGSGGSKGGGGRPGGSGTSGKPASRR